MSTEAGKPKPHPAQVPVALIVNDIANGKIKGTPRQIADQIIAAVFAGEVEKWEGYIDVYEGGEEVRGLGGKTHVKETGNQVDGTHHRRCTAFYGPWEKGSPVEPNKILKRHPITGEDPPEEKPVSPSKALSAQAAALATQATAQAKAFRDFAAQTRATGMVVDARMDGGSIRYENKEAAQIVRQLEADYRAELAQREMRRGFRL